MKYAMIGFDNLVTDVFETDSAIATHEALRPVADGVDVIVDDYYDSTTGEFRRPTKDELNRKYKPDFNRIRKKFFADTEWARQRHSDRMDMDIDDSNNWLDWLQYWQSLRDMTSDPDFDPCNPQWPVMPE